MMVPLLVLFLSVLALQQAAAIVPVSAFVQQLHPQYHSSRSFGTTHQRRPFGLVMAASSSRTSNGDPAPITSSPERPIVVLGAGGKTGRIIVQLLAEQQYVCAVTRTTEKAADLEHYITSNKPSAQKCVSYAVADVTRYDDVLGVLQKAPPAAVVWAATSSGVKKGGGDAPEVDYKGAYHAAKACLECNVPKFVFISASCVTRPTSLGSRAVNMLTQWTYGDCPWVDAKMAGETAVRDLYRERAGTNDKTKNKSAYAIVRPAAALSNKPPIPVDQLVVMQGDVYSSAESISRTNVAQVVVNALLKGAATDFVTFEVAPAVRLYENDEGNVIDLLGLPTPKQTTVPDLPKNLVNINAASYEELLDGLVTDEEMLNQYGSIVSDYRGGEAVPSVEAFA